MTTARFVHQKNSNFEVVHQKCTKAKITLSKPLKKIRKTADFRWKKAVFLELLAGLEPATC